MRRIMLALLAGAVLSAGTTWALASHAGEFFPSECEDADGGTDIIAPDSKASYTPGLLTVDLVLGGASCLAADYSLVVLDEDPAGGTPAILDAVTFPGDGTSSAFTITRPIADQDAIGNQRVCVNLSVSTTEHIESGSDSSSSTAPSGNGSAPSMQDTDTDTNSLDTETIVDWGAESGTGAIPCVVVQLSTPGSGSRGFN